MINIQYKREISDVLVLGFDKVTPQVKSIIESGHDIDQKNVL